MEYIKLCSLMISTHKLCPPPSASLLYLCGNKNSATKMSSYTSASRLPFMFPSCRPLGIYSSDWSLILQRTFWNVVTHVKFLSPNTISLTVRGLSTLIPPMHDYWQTGTLPHRTGVAATFSGVIEATNQNKGLLIRAKIGSNLLAM